ncbi:hypothetical protein ACFS2C_02320 [Prauserella oleivorans]|uniref:Uncharacterized protein n=1 Tax=Prauserella oleivorans TaxID=1478153 RepID=A0ABW5W4V1_9PSEU
MKHRKDNAGEAAGGIPEPDPPQGGPNADDETPSPADVTPGLGGTSETKPPTTDEDDDR